MKAVKATRKPPLVSFRIGAVEYASLQEAAKASGLSMSEFVRNAVSSRLGGPLEVIEVTSGGAQMIVDSPAKTMQRRTRNVVPSVSKLKTTGDIQVTID